MASVSERMTVSLKVNGRAYSKETEARRTLADFLRDDLGLTGTHLGCEHGACGACTIMIDGNLARSCLTLAVQAQGASLTTVEGLARGNELHPVQKAFKEHHALQCGYCTPGFLITAAALIDAIPDPSEGQVREWLSGNICRCTGYQFIVDAVLCAAQEVKQQKRSA
jgi:carbon-monoxide dehydrogenase small subunit